MGEALYRAICKRSPHTEPQTFGQAVGWFVARAGGNVSAAARAAGVSRRTFRDWLDGKGHGTARAGDVLAAARAGERRERLKPGREKRLRRAPAAGMTFAGRYNYDGKPGKEAPTRSPVQIGRYVQPDTIGHLIDLFLSGASLDALRDGLAGSATEDPTGFYMGTLGHTHNEDHGWSVDSVDLEGNDGDE